MISKLIANLPDKFAKPQLERAAVEQIDLAKAFCESLESPLFYPPLNQTVFPGDQVALAIQSNLPHACDVINTFVDEFVRNGFSANDLTIVVTKRMGQQLELDLSRFESVESKQDEPPPVVEIPFGDHQLKFQVHDTENSAGHSYLAANEAGEPVMVNRVMVDADVVIPVGALNPGDTGTQVDCVYPTFSSSEIIERFDKDNRFLARRQEIELANDTLGSFFVVQLVCGPGNEIQRVICGARKDATELALSETNKTWKFEWEGDAEVTVATIESEPIDQQWDDVATAVVTANRVAAGNGPIVVWADISGRPSSPFKKACSSQFEDINLSKLNRSIQDFAAVLKERPVFLRSGLNREVTEELGLGYIEELEQVVRISEPYECGLLIRDAHRCQVVH